MKSLLGSRCVTVIIALVCLQASLALSLSKAQQYDKQSGAALSQAMILYSQEKWEAAYKKALPLAQGGVPTAQRLVGNILSAGKTGNGKKDFTAARKWWKLAAEQGDTQAQMNYGLSYLNGDGVTADPVIAEDWLLEAARGGDADAMIELAKQYISGSQGIHAVLLIGLCGRLPRLP